jgi:hypothetical protein
MDPYQGRGGGSGDGLGRQASSFVGSLLTYLRTRSPEHWLFFALGIILGLLIH